MGQPAISIGVEYQLLSILIFQLEIKVVGRILIIIASLCHCINCCPDSDKKRLLRFSVKNKEINHSLASLKSCKVYNVYMSNSFVFKSRLEVNSLLTVTGYHELKSHFKESLNPVEKKLRVKIVMPLHQVEISSEYLHS